MAHYFSLAAIVYFSSNLEICLSMSKGLDLFACVVDMGSICFLFCICSVRCMCLSAFDRAHQNPGEAGALMWSSFFDDEALPANNLISWIEMSPCVVAWLGVVCLEEVKVVCGGSSRSFVLTMHGILWPVSVVVMLMLVLVAVCVKSNVASVLVCLCVGTNVMLALRRREYVSPQSSLPSVRMYLSLGPSVYSPSPWYTFVLSALIHPIYRTQIRGLNKNNQMCP